MPNVLVIAEPSAYYLKPLVQLPGSANLTITNDLALASAKSTTADIIFNAVFGPELLRQIFPAAAHVRWVHSISAGVDHVLFPELRNSDVPLTNGRGAFARSLGEFVIAGALYFAKKIPELQKQQASGKWASFDVDELHGKTMGIVGYGEIGRAAGERAKAFGMRVIALRRRPELSGGDPALDAAFGPDRLSELVRESDYLVVAAPNTPETRGMIGDAEFAAMKPSAVIINVGRGPVISEPALIAALTARRIRGAVLDVFDKEPLPEGHPFYTLDNVLMSFHSADHVDNWIENAVEVFVRNYGKFERGEPLENIVDKQAGY